MLDNQISSTLTDEAKAEILKILSDAASRMEFLISVDSKSRRKLAKLGDGSRAFVDKALETVRQSSGYLARDFDIGEFERDVALFYQLDPVRQAIVKLLFQVESTQLRVGAEAMSAALKVYKDAKNSGDAALEPAIAELSRRFARASDEGTTDDATDTPPSTP